MRTFRQLSQDVQHLAETNTELLRSRLFDFLLYSPKLPDRISQQEFLKKADLEQVSVYDRFFEKKDLKINTYSWGKGPLILLTHGWGSKAADFLELISFLNQYGQFRVIAFDAPGNGSSEGSFSNLLLYVSTVEKIMQKWGEPEILIGHSLGAMANMIAVKNVRQKPKLMFSLAPLVNLADYFKSMMKKNGVSHASIDQFFRDFNAEFRIEASYFDLNTLYDYTVQNHWIFYNEQDEISPFKWLDDFLRIHADDIKAKSFQQVGHYQMLKNELVIKEIGRQMDRLISG